ncbi:MAG: hypothetical protein FWF88_02325 [Peptococcaceae bacterium]|nr:hypothetical protein [Peptococcaceae bacterium]
MRKDELIVFNQAGWIIEPNSDKSLYVKFSEHEKKRLENIPDKLIDLICGFNVYANPEETAWFVTHEMFGKATENEFEAQSIEATLDDDDLRNEVTDFWSSHFCFLMSVKSFTNCRFIVTEPPVFPLSGR